MIRTVIEIVVGIIIFMFGAVGGMMVTCLCVAARDYREGTENEKAHDEQSGIDK